ncbi:MAG TPA: alginate export family protein [Myxococcota bacterium]|nr:alginate export family protein [Myxococcota bacterium]
MLFLILSASASEVELTPELQVRPRFEFRSLDRDAAAVHAVTQRSRLGLTATRGALSGHVVVQDVRAWGEEGHTLTDYAADNLGVHSATLTWAPSDSVALTVGRQEIALNEHRLIGTVNWAQQAQSFDGLRLLAENGDMHVELAAIALREGDTETWGTHDTALMGIVSAGWKGADVIYIPEVDWATDSWRHTGGVYARGKAGILSGRIEAYGQLTPQDPAGMIGVRGGVAPELSSKPTITLWWDSLSPRFNTLYATNHKFYGLADVGVFQLGDATRGLHDAALKLKVSPTEKTSVKLDSHLFLAADDTSLLGEEIDLWGGAMLDGGLAIGVGGSAFLYADDTPTQLWMWLQLDARL